MKRSQGFSVVGLILLAAAATLSVLAGTANASYEGTLRIYIVEPTSRWRDWGGANYGFGFLDWGLVTPIDINDSETWQQSVTWDGTAAGYGDITQGNIMAIAVLFNAVGETRDAIPPLGYWFTSYPVDAAAAATPGSPGQNQSGGGYTHTVFVEEGTVTT